MLPQPGSGLPIDRRQQIWRRLATINRELDHIVISSRFTVQPSDREWVLMRERIELRREMRKLTDTN